MAFCTEIHETCTGSIISILLSAKVHETCTGSIISIFHFFPRTSGQEALYSKRELKKIEIIEPAQVSCTLTLRRIEIIEPVQVSCISPLRKLNTSKCLLTRSPSKKVEKIEIIEPVQVSYT